MTIDPSTEIAAAFGTHRAEWASTDAGEFFVAPPYQGALLHPSRPCFLIGGRGTGKTTALQHLASQGQQTEHLAIYIRLNKNQVELFTDIPSDLHSKCFGHFLNLLICIELLRGHSRRSARPLSADLFRRLQTLFSLPDTGSSATQLHDALIDSLDKMEVAANNSDLHKIAYSPFEKPITLLASELSKLSEPERSVWVCLDEWENLTEAQQTVANGLIKQSENPIAYKIGVRTGGIKTAVTRRDGDRLQHPADYERIEIMETNFEDFAEEVANRRLKTLAQTGWTVESELRKLLPLLPLREELETAAAKNVAGWREELAGCPDVDAMVIPTRYLALMAYWRDASGEDLSSLAKDYERRPTEWKNRLGTYMFPVIMWLSRGRQGIRIRKHYTGCDTFLAMANGNIRFFLQLVNESLLENSRDPEFQTRVLEEVPARRQTIAARRVGKYRIASMDDVSRRDIPVRRLALVIGRVLMESSRNPAGKTPDSVYFTLSGKPEDREEAISLLREGVQHQFFSVELQNKLTSPKEFPDDAYRLHPIMSAFFEISPARKRGRKFDAKTLVRATRDPKGALRQLLNAPPSAPPPELVLDQLSFFDDILDTSE